MRIKASKCNLIKFNKVTKSYVQTICIDNVYLYNKILTMETLTVLSV